MVYYYVWTITHGNYAEIMIPNSGISFTICILVQLLVYKRHKLKIIKFLIYTNIIIVFYEMKLFIFIY